MAGSVQNTVSTVFTATDKTTEVLKRITVAAQQATAATNLLNGRLRQMGTAATAGGFGSVAAQFAILNHAAMRMSRSMQEAARQARNLRSAAMGIRPPSDVAVRPTVVRAADAGGGGTRRTVAPGGKVGTFLASTAATIYTIRTIGETALGAERRIMSLHETYEDMKITFAGQIQATGMAKTFEDADNQAAHLMVRLRQMAAKLPGDMNYYAQMVQEASTSLFMAGVPNMEGVLDFVGRYGTAVFGIAARHHDLGMASRELFAMVGGTARRQMPLFNYLSQFMDKAYQSVERFNDLSPAERFQQLEKALAGFKDVSANAFTLFSAKSGEFKDRLSEIMRLGSMPMFEKAAKYLDDMNKYLDQNHVKLERMVRILVDELYDVVHGISEGFRFMAEHADAILTATKGFAAIWASQKLIGGISAVANALAGIGIGAGVGAAGAAGAAGFMPLGAIAFGGGALAGKVSASLLTATMTPEEMLGDVAARYFGGEEAERYSKILEYKRKFEPMLAQATAGVTDPYAISDATEKLLQQQYLQNKGNKFIQTYLEQIAELRGYEIVPFGDVSKEFMEPPKDRPKNNYDFRYSRFDIKQNFAEGFDPDRIAVAFANDLSRLGEMRVSSQFAPLFGVR